VYNFVLLKYIFDVEFVKLPTVRQLGASVRTQMQIPA